MSAQIVSVAFVPKPEPLTEEQVELETLRALYYREAVKANFTEDEAERYALEMTA